MRLVSISKNCRLLFAFVSVFGLVAFVTPLAHAQTFSVVHNFTGGSDGGYPQNGFTIDAYGNLYGTASSGGNRGFGVAFKLSKAGRETVLYNFTNGADGGTPDAGLLRTIAGTLYGTTAAGGAFGAGAVFKLVWKTETVLYSFAGGHDGADPEAGLTMDAHGNLYGTTAAGGANGKGTVFRLTPPKQGGKWTETVLYSFGAGTDGATPIAGVSFDTAGNLYGTTSAGGAYGLGTVFQLKPGPTWTENILHNFQNADDGAIPYAGLISDQSGHFYGAATQGGTGGGGTVFELAPSNGNWIFTVLYSQPGWGISGSFRDLILDASGNLYGTTHCDGAYNAGTVYKLTPSGGTWTYTSLYVFTGGTDGLYSFSNLVLNQGKVYGTTKNGGANSYGVVFEVTP